jgi:putative transferase (TIGR04331 family)
MNPQNVEFVLKKSKFKKSKEYSIKKEFAFKNQNLERINQVENISKNSILVSNLYLRSKKQIKKIVFEKFDVLYGVITENKSTLKKIDTNLRNNIFRLDKKDSFFEYLLWKVVEKLLPLSLLEGLSSGLNGSQKLISPYIKGVVSALDIRYNEGFLYWIVAQKQKYKTIFIQHQHGGGYGLHQDHTPTNDETLVSDFFFTWGWTYSKTQIPSNAIQLFGIPKKRKRENSKKILFVGTDRPKQTHRFQSIPLSGQSIEYFKNQEDFYQKLNSENQLKFSIKEYPITTDFNLTEWHKKYEVHKETLPLDKTYERGLYALYIFDHNGTGYLETLMLNIPTILIWSEKFEKIESKALNYVELLIKSNILFFDINKATEFLNKNSEKIDRWWFEKNTQKKIKIFSNEFLNITKNSFDDWNKQVSDIVRQ